MELQIASDREKEALHRFEELYLFMQRHIQDSQVVITCIINLHLYNYKVTVRNNACIIITIFGIF